MRLIRISDANQRQVQFQLISLLEQNAGIVKISNNKSKIIFSVGSSLLISKVIDGRFPDYSKVVPVNNSKTLQIKLNDFKESIERVTTVSSDHKEGLKILATKESLKLSVNNPNSGEGSENIIEFIKIICKKFELFEYFISLDLVQFIS